MRSDHLTYRRAANVAMLGLALHVVLGVVVLIYAVLARDHAAGTFAFYAALGVPAWLMLALVFDQHRREQIEALEAEALAASESAAGSVFERDAGQFRVAARRLAGMYRYVLPGASVALGAGLIGLGAWRLQTASGLVPPGHLPKVEFRGWAFAIALGAAFVGFILARYASGMAKQKAWAGLRAGASYSAGAALLGLATAAAHLVDYVGPDTLLVVMPRVFAIALIVLGGEVFLNFLLDLYRPRRAGEGPRPAFDSRILGFVAAPDQVAASIGEAINYQLGIDVSGTWFYALLKKRIALLVGVGLLILWGQSALAVVRPHQRGMILRFGQYRGEVGPGLHVKAPWPIDRLDVPEQIERDASGKVTRRIRSTSGVRVLELGASPPTTTGPILWTTEHAQNEVLQIVQASGGSADDERRRGDLALVAVEAAVHYAVRDARLYDELAPPEERDRYLRAVGQGVLLEYLSRLSAEEVLGGKRVAMPGELKSALQSAFDGLNPGPDSAARGAGIELIFVGVRGVHPPQKTAKAFEGVVAAGNLSGAKVEAARASAAKALTEVVGSTALGDEIVRELDALERLREGAGREQAAVVEQEFKIQRLLERAGGRAAATINRAAAERWTKHMDERARAARYRGLLESFRASPSVFMVSAYFDAMAGAMAESRVYIVSDRALQMFWELPDRDTALDVFDQKSE